MAISIRHANITSLPDDPDYEIGSNEWNDNHTLSGALPVANGGTGQTTEAEALGEMIQALTEDTAPDSADFIVTYDTSADTGKKVQLSAFGRVVLNADRTFYVRTDGSDSNDGSANTAGSAWLTLQNAYDTIRSHYDFNGYEVEIKLADGTYTPVGPLLSVGYIAGAVCLLRESWVGGGSLRITGNLSNPSACYLHADDYSGGAGGIVNVCNLSGHLYIGGFKIDAGEEGINQQGSGNITIYGDMSINRCTNGCFTVFGGGNLTIADDITITVNGPLAGATASLFLAESGGSLTIGTATINLNNNPTLTTITRAQIDGTVNNTGATFSGSFTGTPYLSRWGGNLINCYPGYNGFPAGTLPGILYADAVGTGVDRIRDLLVTETTTSNTSLSATTTELKGKIDVSAKVNFKFTVWYDTPTAADFKFDLDGESTTPTLLSYTVRYIGPDDTSMTTKGTYQSYNQVFTITATSGTKGYVEVEGVLHNSASTAHYLTFRYAQNTSDGSATSVYAGSCVTISRFHAG